ncbi:hypothetical protein IMX17_07465 [Serratia sp. X3]|uniref:hypothetical protein n=1 Tax=Serratia sp. X3 TaxID=2780495 RepID=UPI001873C5DF|nr:hypothetical protein [Serratia sp. X3]MBE4973233.1 hypothetical protein [Serratia sp. X3]
MKNITISYFATNLTGMHREHVESGRNGPHKYHIIQIPINEVSKVLFDGWRRDQGVYFDCKPSGSGDYFLVDETEQAYIFKTK